VVKNLVFLVLKHDLQGILEGPFEIVSKSVQKNAIPGPALPATEKNIVAHFKNLSQNAYYALLALSNDAIQKHKANISREIKKFASGTKATELIQDKMQSHIYEAMRTLLHFAGEEINFYFKTIHPVTGNIFRSPCTISEDCFINEFQITNDDQQHMHVNTYMQVHDEVLPLNEFITQHFFFISKGTEVFLIRTEDRRALQLAHGLKATTYSDDAIAFHDCIIAPLQKTHHVEIYTTHQTETIDADLTCAIQLGEIGDMYINIEPVFIYDGVPLEESDEAITSTSYQGKAYNFIRKTDSEKEFINYLKQQHPRFAKKSQNYTLTFAEAKQKNWFLHFYRSLLENNYEVRGMDMMKHFRFNENIVATAIKHISNVNTTTRLQITVSFGKINVPLKELQKTVFANATTILLSDNSLGVLTDEWYAQYGTIIKHANIIGDKQIDIANWILMQADMQLHTVVDAAMPNAAEWRRKWQHWQANDKPLFKVPKTVDAKFRAYQQKGFEWMCLLSEIGAGCLLADDMGLGKTLQTIAFAAYTLQQHKGARSLIIAPASLLYNWKNEFAKFAPSIKVAVFEEHHNNMAEFVESDTQVLIMSYGLMRSNNNEASAFPWQLIVLDESHNVKNPGTLQTKAVLNLKAPYRVCISGTPVLNSSFDLYSQFQFLAPDLLGDTAFFKKQYLIPIEVHQSQKHAEQLKRITEPFILRRTKEQVATDLPEKTVSVRYCTMAEDQLAFYNTVKDSIKSSVFLQIENNGLNKSLMNVMQGINMLRKICSTPLGMQHDNATCDQSIKVHECVQDILEKTANHKVLVFSQFLATLDQIQAELKENHIPHFRIDGSIKASERAALNKQFEEDSNTRVFLLSITAASQGLNLVSADYVYILDPWWNLGIENQAIDRSHRIGQTKPVFAHKLICKDTIEDKILEMQMRKGDLGKDLIKAEEGFAKNLNIEDVQWLFE
jgi:superfamily II DNA or RNA helicase